MHSESLLVTWFASLVSKTYLKPNLGVQNESCGQNNFFFIFPKEIQRHSHAVKTIALWSLRYESQNSKNFALRLRINLLQFSGTSIYLFWLKRKPVRDNLMLSPFSDLKGTNIPKWIQN